MQIAGWRIDGFGIFTDAVVADLPPGLTLVTGPNEAGKSTLLAFLRGVLFGFPDGRMRARRHEPVNGGRHGGAVLLRDESGGLWTVERHVEPRSFVLRRPDGSPGDASELSHLLGGADSTLFANVFAFGLTELDAFELIDSDAVRERIFSAGVIGAGRSAREALGVLDARRSALVRPRGRCEVRDLADEVRAASRQLAVARAAAADLTRRRADLDRLAAVAEDRRVAADRCREEQHRLKMLLEAWPVRSRIADIDAELSALEVPEGVDAATEADYERVVARQAAAHRSLDEALAAASASERRYEQIVVDDLLAEIAPQVRVLAAGLAVEDGRRDRLGELTHVIAAQSDALDQHLATLGPDWSRDHLAEFDASIPAAEEVRRRGLRLDDMERRLDRLQDERVAVARARSEAQVKLAAIEEQDERDRDLPSAEEAARESRALRQLRAHLVDLGTESARLEGASRSVAGLRAVAPSTRSSGSTGRLAALGVAVLAVIAAGASAAAAADGARELAVGLGVAAVALVIIAAGAALSGRALGRQSSAVEVARQISEAERVAADARDRVEVLRTSVRATSLQLGLSAEPTAIEVEECAARIDRSNQELRDALHRRARASELTGEIREATKRVTELDSEVALLSQRVAKEQDEWGAWKKERGVPPDLGIEAINDLFTSIERARTTLRSLQTVERERSDLAAESEQWRSGVRSVLARVGPDQGRSDVDLVARLRVLADRVETDAAARRAREERRAAHDDARERAAVARERLEDADREHAELLASVGVADDTAFRSLLERHRRRIELEVERSSAWERIHVALGRGEAAAALLDRLETGDRAGWDAALADAAARLPQLEAGYEDAIRNHQDADRSLDELSRSAEVADTALHLESTKARLAERVREWQTLTASRALIADTLARYERERQPAVIARAEQMFARVTAGHYPHLLIADGEVRVVDRRGRHLSTVDLSRGTAEQLYLCVRFGLAAEFASHTPLPFVMDDVLVNFDPERTDAMATVIAELAASHQVLLFSCQPTSVERMRAASPAARVIELPRHGGLGERTAAAAGR
ncbi:MAG: AAA family ATPase [Acidimicrobiales bacterium]